LYGLFVIRYILFLTQKSFVHCIADQFII